MKSFRLGFPAEVTADGVAEVLTTLAGEPRGSALAPAHPTVAETLLSPTGVSWWVRLDGRRARRLQAASSRVLPGLRWDEAERPTFQANYAVELRAANSDRLLDTDLAPAAVARLLGVAGELHGGEAVLVQWQIGPTVSRSAIAPASSSSSSPWWSLPTWEQADRTNEEVTALRKKQSQHVFFAIGRIAVAGATGKRAYQLVAAALGGYHLLRAPGAGLSTRWLPSWWVTRRLDRAATSGAAMRLTATELAAVIGWPIGNPALRGVRYPEATLRPVDERSLQPRPKIGARVVGTSAYPGQGDKAVVQRPEDGLRHTWILGPSGVGKSTLLANLILTDIAAGRGVVAIDPKGDLADEILARISDRDAERVVVIDPSDPCPVGFNPLDGDRLGIDGVLHVMSSIWSGSWGPRLGDTLHAGLLTLAAKPGHSLAELPVLLTDPSFRRPLVSAAVAQDRLGLGTFWPWFDNLSDDARAQVLAPIMNKLRAFLLRPQLRAVLGQARPRFDLNDIFTNQAVVLVRLPKGELGGEAAQLLGSLLVSHLWRLSLARTAVPATRRQPVFIYLDEFQEFLRLPVDLADALVTARGLGVGLVLAHQHLDQLDRSVRSAVLANAASRVAFRLGFEDAKVMAKHSRGGLRPEDLTGLGAYEAYASLLVKGEATSYGSINTLALPPAERDPEVIKAQSRSRYGVDRKATEATLTALIDTGTTPGQDGPSGPIGGRRTNPGAES